jgi:hypothetical protein
VIHRVVAVVVVTTMTERTMLLLEEQRSLSLALVFARIAGFFLLFQNQFSQVCPRASGITPTKRRQTSSLNSGHSTILASEWLGSNNDTITSQLK